MNEIYFKNINNEQIHIFKFINVSSSLDDISIELFKYLPYDVQLMINYNLQYKNCSNIRDISIILKNQFDEQKLYNKLNTEHIIKLSIIKLPEDLLYISIIVNPTDGI